MRDALQKTTVPMLQYVRERVAEDIITGRQGKQNKSQIARMASKSGNPSSVECARTVAKESARNRVFRRGWLLWLAMLTGRPYNCVENPRRSADRDIQKRNAIKAAGEVVLPACPHINREVNIRLTDAILTWFDREDVTLEEAMDLGNLHPSLLVVTVSWGRRAVELRSRDVYHVDELPRRRRQDPPDNRNNRNNRNRSPDNRDNTNRDKETPS